MASTAADSSYVVGSGLELSRIIEEHRRQDEKRRVKRAANRKSASTSRARKKAYVDEMTAKNERMKQHALVLSMLPDLVLAVCRTGEMTYVSPACQWLLLHSPEDMTGANIFELVAPECHPLLRKIISENLSRPVKTVGGGVPGGRAFPSSTSKMKEDADGDETEPSDEDEPRCRDKMGNHRERLHQRYRQSQEAGGCSSSGGSSSSSSSGGGGGGGGRSRGSGSASPSSSQAPETKMLRIFRGDKTTVWCEIRLSVRNEKGDDSGSTAGAAPVPLEIILTLRTVAEGCKTAVAHEFAGGELSVAGVEADDDGYQCEVDAEEDSNSNNSGSGNDSGTRRRKATGNASRSPNSDGVKGSSGGGGGGKPRAAISRALETITKAEAAAAGADPTVGREERSLSKKRQRVSIGDGAEGMDGATATAAAAAAEKSGGDNSSTAGDTGGSTTQEGSGSCSNEVDGDSNGEGEGSNNGSASKWGDGDGGGGVSAGVRRSSYRNSCDGGSGSDDGDGDAASEGTSAEGTDFGDDVQTAVQSLILMGGDLNKAGE